ncbi:phosphatidylglycerol lysyltransferase domain-containing protein [Aliiroseovarius crassostreae]|uniref:phosphatidylglycerol lysyltransferase domain-containing protein n=1 Tax=Aliiroseovarius crassostreae TaxID=154981 RepID=UPI003C7B6342
MRQTIAAAMARAATVADADGVDVRRLLARQMLPLGFAIGIVWLLWGQLDGLDFRHVLSSLKTVSPMQWGLAAALSALSFWALGRYDRVVHRLIGSDIRSGPAQLSGVTAIALSQTVGLGVISSALVRWRMLPQISLMRAVQISMIVSVSFLSAWAVVAALVALCVPLALPGSVWIAWAVLTAAVLLVGLSILRPALLSRLNLPSVKAMGAFVMLAAIDTAAAGAALWAVMPADCDIQLLPLVAAYMIALGAGLISGTPGGVGPFEVTLLALLPQLDPEPLLAAILVFRTIYYAIPALIAAVLTIRGPQDQPDRPDTRAKLVPLDLAPNLPARLSRAISDAPRAETALLRQGLLSALELGNGRAAFMARRSGQSLILLSDPLRVDQQSAAVLQDVQRLASESYVAPILYKIGARMALSARRACWVTLPIAREAWLNPTGFTLEGSSRRQLRRKLRQAEKAGVTICKGGADLPVDEMDQIARTWCRTRGGERGFSMGTWQPETLPHAQVFLAHQNDQLVGFATFHKNTQEQVLDLMRLTNTAPDGTMQMLVTAAIEDAAKSGCARLSLAAVPLGKQAHEPALFHKLRDTLDQISGAAGLRQFKSAFGPNWETLYMAAPNRRALVFGAMDVAREIARPAKCPGAHTG